MSDFDYANLDKLYLVNSSVNEGDEACHRMLSQLDMSRIPGPSLCVSHQPA